MFTWEWCVRLDKRLGQRLGWSGQYTISAECFRRKCVLCRVIKRLFGEQHCLEAARDEGLL